MSHLQAECICDLGTLGMKHNWRIVINYMNADNRFVKSAVQNMFQVYLADSLPSLLSLASIPYSTSLSIERYFDSVLQFQQNLVSLICSLVLGHCNVFK